MEIAAGGNVGIGTTSPGGKLHIRSGSSGTTANVNGKNLIVENNDAAGISVLTPDGNTPSLFLGTASDSAAVQIAGGYNSGGATEKLRLLVNNVEAMNILGSGNVGIGTTTPGAKLTVAGDVYINSNANGPIIRSPNTNCFRITVNNGGGLGATGVACP